MFLYTAFLFLDSGNIWLLFYALWYFNIFFVFLIKTIRKRRSSSVYLCWILSFPARFLFHKMNSWSWKRKEQQEQKQTTQHPLSLYSNACPRLDVYTRLRNQPAMEVYRTNRFFNKEKPEYLGDKLLPAGRKGSSFQYLNMQRLPLL